jgi:Protein of unknown function (DUF2905)
MLRWLITTFIALLIISAVAPWLRKIGIGRLPGDLQFRIRGREYSLPFASTVLLSLLVWGLSRLI